jgi:hypothetical protein
MKTFQQRVIEHLKAVGARKHDGLYDYELDTDIGTLLVSVYEDWIAGRWVDIDRALKVKDTLGPNFNLHTGKWNFVFANPTIEHVNYFISQLGPFLS